MFFVFCSFCLSFIYFEVVLNVNTPALSPSSLSDNEDDKITSHSYITPCYYFYFAFVYDKELRRSHYFYVDDMTSISYFYVWLLIVGFVHGKTFIAEKAASHTAGSEESPLRLFFRHIDLNGNDEIDVYELQHFFHDIDPEDPIAEPKHVIRTMNRVMQQTIGEDEKSFHISWQQFRKYYANFDSPVANGLPEVCYYQLTFFAEYPL